MKDKFSKKGHFKDFKKIKIDEDKNLTGNEIFKKHSRRELSLCFVKNKKKEDQSLITRDEIEEATKNFLSKGGEIKKIEYQEEHKEKVGLIITGNSEDDDEDYSVNYPGFSFKIEIRNY